MKKLITIPVPIPEDADFKMVYKKFGSKIQKNVPLTEPLLKAVEEQGGAEYLVKLAVKDLHEKDKLPQGYGILLDF